MRPDDSKFVYALKPAIWVGAVAAMLTLFASPLLPLGTPDDRFVAMLGVFAGVTFVIAHFRIRRRKLDASVYRSRRPRGWRTDDDWRFWIPPAVIVFGAFIFWLVTR